MSVYGEDTELRDVLAQTLESNGALAKIRAQLRASAFLAFHEDEVIQKKKPLVNKKLMSQLESAEGKTMFCIVYEFLEYFSLDYTKSVYEPETYAGDKYKYEGRNKLIETLNLDANDTVPLLLQLIKIAAQERRVHGTAALVNGDRPCSNGDIKNKIMNETFVTNSNSDESDEPKQETPRSSDTFEGTSSIAEDSIKENNLLIDLDRSSSNSNSNSGQAVEVQVPRSLLDATLNDISTPVLKKEKPKGKSSLSSLSDLPPLQLNKSRSNDLLPSLYTNDFSDKEMDKLFNADPLDNYEEDFMLDVDVNQSRANKSNNSLASSVTSEEFDFNSNLDDILKSDNST